MIIGITGSFGTGKTTVANMFAEYGFEVINADRLYHGIYKKDKRLKNKILNEFGTLDRDKIKKIVFNDPNKLKKLNKITHPIIIKEIKKEISSIIYSSNKKYAITRKSNKKSNSIINLKNNKKLITREKKVGVNLNDNIKIALDVPLLIEAKMQNMVDNIIVVKCSEKIKMERLLKKGRHTKEEIENIIKSQMPIQEKLKYADFVVDNSAMLNETKRQVKKIITRLNVLGV